MNSIILIHHPQQKDEEFHIFITQSPFWPLISQAVGKEPKIESALLSNLSLNESKQKSATSPRKAKKEKRKKTISMKLIYHHETVTLLRRIKTQNENSTEITNSPIGSKSITTESSVKHA